MAIDKRDNGVAIIDEYSLADFVVSIQKCVQEGYEISLENDNYPQGMSGWYRVGMVKTSGTETETEAEKPKAATARSRK